MRVRSKLRGAACGLAALMILLSHAEVAWAAKCNDVAGRGFLKILTLNLLFSEIEDRDNRLDDIADYVANKKIDVVVVQEVVGGLLTGTSNSAADLDDKLEDRGLDYDRRTDFEVGVPGLLEVGNATLSRCQILFAQTKRLPKTTELEFLGLTFKLPRNVQMTRIKIPGFGKFSVYNTHLCAGCSFSEQEEQVDAMLAFVDQTEASLPADNPIMLGGDLNIDRFKSSPPEAELYDLITAQGFNDAYAEAKALQGLNLAALCDSGPDKHCTIGVGVTELSDSSPKRIDYIFDKRFGTTRKSSQVVFNSEAVIRSGAKGKTVSDHAAVYIKANLPN